MTLATAARRRGMRNGSCAAVRFRDIVVRTYEEGIESAAAAKPRSTRAACRGGSTYRPSAKRGPRAAGQDTRTTFPCVGPSPGVGEILRTTPRGTSSKPLAQPLQPRPRAPHGRRAALSLVKAGRNSARVSTLLPRREGNTPGSWSTWDQESCRTRPAQSPSIGKKVMGRCSPLGVGLM
jgi:hypothetical protein